MFSRPIYTKKLLANDPDERVSDCLLNSSVTVGASSCSPTNGGSGRTLATSLASQFRTDPDVDGGLVGMSVGGGRTVMILLEAA
ncbi:hypothetical protein AArcMg_1180 [Natrarchaeobaculum sulfurireducens]|uniref:Uncharacterized protein n=1 Tax=Natrarchaeobaculum sulfurireducens TaxID=2044521 RepID=A0A346PGV9_9EURY|nr:hypothetical protein AArc1_2439 [Natrarchaeobaculum sulfurireducens]AXR81196.1 hypothetical protein AArcMg_1180 [Natrarchaeobaculum sulfurireducens]